MAARQRIGLFIASVAALVLVAMGIVGVITRTEWGQERVRRQLVGILNDKTAGTVTIGKITGNLLDGVTIEDLEIRDSLGVPFLQVEKASARYSLRALWSERLIFNDVTMVNPVLIFDRPPGMDWNVSRLWPSDPSDGPEDPAINWGDVFSFNNVRVINGTIVVRAAWSPNDSLTATQRDSVLRYAMGPKGTFVIVESNGGYQRVSRFDRINGRFPVIRIADPEEDWMKVEVTTASMVAAPFKGPVARIQDLRGKFEFEDDSAWFDKVRVRLPSSRLVAGGKYYPNDDNLIVRMDASYAAFRDFQWAWPDFPDDGGGPIDFTMTWWDGVDTYALKDFDLRTGRSRVIGDATVKLFNGPDTVVFSNTDLRLINLDTRLIAKVPPGLEFPRVGTLNGNVSVAGSMARLRVDADVAYNDAEVGANNIVANGIVGLRGPLSASNLRLSLEPVRVALVREYVPDFPIDGTISGNVVVDGNENQGLSARGALVHNGSTGRSAVNGRGSFQLAGARRVNVDVRLRPLSLATVGRFAPDAGLRGTASGRLALSGTMSNMRLDTDLALSGGGEISAEGTLNLAGNQPSYNVRTQMRVFNANAILAEAPRTTLTGNVAARGRGTDPATMNATFAGSLRGIRIDTLTADSVEFRVALSDGLARVDTLIADGPAIHAVANGTFGMREGRTGRLTYDITIDSLHAFEPLVPGAVDTTTIAARPRARAVRLARARADSARIAEATEVERAATGRAGPGPIRVSTPAPKVRADSVSGWVRARGVLTGNVKRMSTTGTVEMRDVVLRGITASRGSVDYSIAELRTPAAKIEAKAKIDGFVARGFVFDSLRASVDFADPEGTADLALFQPGGDRYGVNGRFVVHDDHNEVHLLDMRMTFDTTRWVATRPSTIQWGGAGVTIREFEMRDGNGGRLYVNGLLPTEGNAQLDIETTRFQIGDIARLAQTDLPMRGLVDMDARIEGSMERPRIRGTLSVQDGVYGETSYPDIRGTFGYAAGVLTTRMEAIRKEGPPLMIASGRIPLNLGTGRTGPLFPDEQLDVTINADSLPLDLIPSLVGTVADVRGAARGDIRVRGTLSKPIVEGTVNLANGEATIVPTGMKLKQIAARFRLEDAKLIIDTLAANAHKGRVGVTGTIDLATLTEPGFDLRVSAENARVLDNDRGKLSADAFISIKGPFDAVVATGSANIRNGVIYIPETNRTQVLRRDDPAIFAVVDTAVRSEVELLPTESSLFENLSVNIALSVQRDTWVRSTEANVEIYGDLLIRMDPQRDALALEGSIYTDRGEYSVFSKRFQVRQGTATFLALPTQGLNPLLQITAEYEIREPTREAIVIRLVIGGTLENPNLALESNAQPPIPQGELLSYLAFGRSGGTLLQLGGSGLAGASASGGLGGSPLMSAAGQTLTGMAIGVLADQAEGEATRSFGVDMFNIEPAPEFLTELRSDPSNILKKTEIEIGKYINPRTFVAFQTLLGGSATPGAKFQTRVRGGLRLETSFEPRIGISEPTLETKTRKSYGVFGAYAIREWRF
jgi:translocation and assembly module TamB